MIFFLTYGGDYDGDGCDDDSNGDYGDDGYGLTGDDGEWWSCDTDYCGDDDDV